MNEKSPLQVVSYLAPNNFWFYESLVAYLERVLKIEAHLVQSHCDPIDDTRLWQNKVDLAFICGLALMRHSQQHPQPLKAIVALVMQNSRYQNLPIYFSDIIVNSASSIAKFEDLAQKTLCYNDLGSHSGYHVLRDRLIQGNYPQNFFGRTLQSGSHQRSIHWVAEQIADFSAIDSTVLAQELRDFPELLPHLRIIESLGPSPMPPVVVAQHLGDNLIAQIRSALLHPDALGQIAMERAGIWRFAPVQSADYESLIKSFERAIAMGYGVLA